ncbi:TerD family protein [Cellulomonas gilvus]|uniref:Stress protein n=1 Tax=Cellulomonas gilvus (strain ATCC 13127 / NRRL B-14078) TaxID=593907 RepID=F8A6I3_CELGA|nr:TerD family protein [Cellulomonas gilvus]AEI13471.1 stress protein [Cellulomonas gilvus ATCC 13127]
MDQLTKGTNAPLHASRVTLTVDVPAPADLSALLVTEDGKVRTDADFVFYNQPTGPGVRCVQPTAGQAWRVEVDLAAVPADVHAVRLVTSLDDASATFGGIGQPVAHVSDDAGTPLFAFPMTGLTTESIVVALEVYRRAGAWKVRAVGQGYAGGLADLITDHGVSVEDAPPPPAPAPVAAPVPPTPVAPAPAAPPPAPAAPAEPAEVQLTKARPVSLSKGQKVTLTKDGGVALTMVRMGLGWDPVRKRGMFGSREVEIDLDASAVLLAGTEPVDVAFYNNLRTRDGSVQHTGDNRTGEGDGDDETILIDLTRVPVHVTSVMLVVSSYEGHTFEQVQNAFCRLVDHTTGAELARYTLAGGMPHTGMIMARVYRQGSAWKLQAVGEGIQARTPSDAIPALIRYLG